MAAEFREGRVLEADSGRLRIEPAEGGDSIWTASSDVYSLADASEPSRGDFAICRSAPSKWVSCRVRSIESSRFDVELADRRGVSMPGDAVLAARPVTVLNIKRHFERSAERRNFVESLTRAGDPRRPSPWIPGPHARVMARIEGRWYQAKIHEYDDEVPRVSKRVVHRRIRDRTDSSGAGRSTFVVLVS